MKKFTLNGDWQFRQSQSNEWLSATVPSDNFSDLLALGKIEDPYVGLNEEKVQWVGEQDWIYRKIFVLTARQLEYSTAELNFEMLDTLCTVYVNGEAVAECDNANIGYVFDVKKYLKEGENCIEIVFRSPVKFIREKQSQNPLPPSFNGLDGAPYIRKNQSHFGWDWGPTIPLSGITRDAYINFYDVAKISDLSITQHHGDKGVSVEVSAEVANNADDNFEILFQMLSPDGVEQKIISKPAAPCATFTVDNPQLWWPNGMSDAKIQPLYTITVSIFKDGKALYNLSKRIGLRTLVLDRSADKYGNQFRFIVNGVPIFARGANWIPADSLISRFTADKLDYFMTTARDCNMNMLRVWGGGYYESDAFYDKCDEYGILIWQDFAYACAPYPFYDEAFLANCNAEAVYNVRRLRHHASLALWCGNNELESCSLSWYLRKELLRWTEKYFWHILPDLVAKHDANTPYIASSPVGTSFMKDYTSDNVGDTHLWAVWHGFKPLTYYRTRFTRFCSEFGLESLPDMKTVEYFARPEEQSMDSPVFMAHQKCKSGNNKILTYITTRFRLPKKLDDLAYLSGIIQGECVKDATEHWRRNRGRCNGSIYWQMNDCWPVNSWASIDYFGRYKPLQYFAKCFDAPQTISAYNEGSVVRIFAINDRTTEFPCKLRYTLETFDGKKLDTGELDLIMPAVSSKECRQLDYKKIVRKYHGNVVFSVKAYDLSDNEIAHECILFKPEKDLTLPKAQIKPSFRFENGLAYVTVSTDNFARYVHLDVRDTYKPFSHNYFHLTAGASRTVCFPLDGMTEEEFIEKFSVKSLCDVTETYGRLHDVLMSVRIRLIPINVANWIAYR